MATVPLLELNDGNRIPQLGFGVFQVDPGETQRVVSEAIEVGYRHLDTAAVYGNEAEVGVAIAESGIPRDEFFVTTKLFNGDQGRQQVRDAVRRSLDALGLDRIDLYLIHWPVPSRDLYVESWHSLEELQGEGVLRSIGVSNFAIEHLERLEREASVVPVINQVELHHAFQQRDLIPWLRQHDIAVEAYWPLRHGRLPEDSEILAIAEAHGKTVAQVLLRWHLQSGHVAIPKSARRSRMAENLDVLDFELSAAELAAVRALDTNERGGRDPHTFSAIGARNGGHAD